MLRHKKIENYLDCIRCQMLLNDLREDWPASDLGQLLADYHKILAEEIIEKVIEEKIDHLDFMRGDIK